MLFYTYMYLLMPSLVLSGYFGNLEVSNSTMLIPSSAVSEAGTTGCLCMPQWLFRTSTMPLHVCRPGRPRTSHICCAVCRHRIKGEEMTQCIFCGCGCSMHEKQIEIPITGIKTDMNQWFRWEKLYARSFLNKWWFTQSPYHFANADSLFSKRLKNSIQHK